MGLIVALLIIAGFFTGIYFIIRSGTKRSEEYKKLAEIMGFKFSIKGDGTLIKEFELHSDNLKNKTVNETNLLVKRED